jgi:hypothetical protein
MKKEKKLRASEKKEKLHKSFRKERKITEFFLSKRRKRKQRCEHTSRDE